MWGLLRSEIYEMGLGRGGCVGNPGGGCYGVGEGGLGASELGF